MVRMGQLIWVYDEFAKCRRAAYVTSLVSIEERIVTARVDGPCELTSKLGPVFSYSAFDLPGTYHDVPEEVRYGD